MDREMFVVGDKVLINCDQWFLAPDGKDYKAVWGTVKGFTTRNKYWVSRQMPSRPIGML